MNGRMKGFAAMLGAGVILCAAAPSFGDAAADTLFMTNAIRGNMAEVKMGELAEQKGASESVRDFGKMLASDHGKALKKHEDLARKKNIVVPTDVSAEQMKEHAALEKLSGRDFDQEFAAKMVDEHQKTVKMYEAEAASNGDPDIVDLAKDTLPKLREHLMTAQKLAAGESTTRTSQRTDSDRRLE